LTTYWLDCSDGEDGHEQCERWERKNQGCNLPYQGRIQGRGDITTKIGALENRVRRGAYLQGKNEILTF